MKSNQIVKNKSWVYRHPKLFVVTTTTAALLVFFSKPIYDIFISTDRPSLEQLQREHVSRFTHK